MKTTLFATFVALAPALVAIDAAATQTNIAGAAFHAFNDTDGATIDYFNAGVWTNSTTSKQITASVTVNPSSTGYTVYIDGDHDGVQTTSCTVWAWNYNYSGPVAHSISATSVSGTWERSVTFTASEISSQYYYLNVICTIAANRTGRILGVTVTP